MCRCILVLALSVFASCGAITDLIDEVTLSQEELEVIADNARGAVNAFADLTEFALQVARGEVEIEGAEWTAPSAENGWQGSLHYIGSEFPGGDGEITVSFTVRADGVPVDPAELDLETVGVLAVDLDVLFTGVTKEGADLGLDAEFTITADSSVEGTEEVVTDGTFVISHNGFVANLVATEFTTLVDTVDNVATSASGTIAGLIDIPEFAFDADVTITGHGDQVQFLIEVLSQTVTDELVPVGDF
jgi:hypothetical protein